MQRSRPTQPIASQPDPLEQLEKLAELRGAGVVNDEEFEATKSALLAKI